MKKIPTIRPVSDLRNNFKEISNLVRETDGPVYLTKNGREDMVVMSHDAYEREQQKHEIEMKLREAELINEIHPGTRSLDDVYIDAKNKIKASK